jgi:hypothetical protein
MLAGRTTNMKHAAEDANGNLPVVWKWADQGEAFLRHEFRNKGLDFHTSVDKEHITLTVYRKNPNTESLQPLFSVRERGDVFVSNLTVTKILMVM